MQKVTDKKVNNIKKKSKPRVFTKKEVVELIQSSLKTLIDKNDIISFFKKNVEDIAQANNAYFNKFAKEISDSNKAYFKKFTKVQEGINDAIMDNLKELEKSKQEFAIQVKDWHETLSFVMHNIKKNQFLYSHYPDEWVKEYSDIKNGLKYENNFIERKIASEN